MLGENAVEVDCQSQSPCLSHSILRLCGALIKWRAPVSPARAATIERSTGAEEFPRAATVSMDGAEVPLDARRRSARFRGGPGQAQVNCVGSKLLDLGQRECGTLLEDESLRDRD